MKVSILAIALALSVPVTAFAGPFADFESQLRSAYGTYRIALFQSNSGNAEVTGKALTELAQGWGVLTETWSATPPPQYADDGAFAATLASVETIIGEATAQVSAGELGAAHLTLEEMREELGALHLRNGIVSFSDRMNAYHAHMEEVLGADLAAMPDALGYLRESAAVLGYLADEIGSHPAPEAADPAYEPLVGAFRQSVAALRDAARSGDIEAAKAAVGGLKMPYAKLFAKFG